MLQTDIIFRLQGLLFPHYIFQIKQCSQKEKNKILSENFPYTYNILGCIMFDFPGNLEGAQLSDGVTSIVAIDFGN